MLGTIVVALVGVGASDKTLVDAALDGMVHLRGFWGRLALRLNPIERAIESLRCATCRACSCCLINH